MRYRISKTQTSPHVITFDNMWRCLGFRHPVSQLARNLMNFLPQPPHAITRHVAKFRDFWTLFGIYIIINHFSITFLDMLCQREGWDFMCGCGYGLNIHQISWLSFFESLSSNISCTCSWNLNYVKKFKETRLIS